MEADLGRSAKISPAPMCVRSEANPALYPIAEFSALAA